MCALIEPGKGSPTVKSDPSKHFQFDRIIRFTRKNREEWHSLTPKTVSSKVIGEAGQDAIVLKTQFTDSDFDAFTDDDGLIQIDKLSTDPKAFLAFLSKEGQVRSGGSLTITLPTSQKVADLLRANHYENYDKADFVRVVTTVDSSILYNKGAPLLTYSIAVRPESKESAAALDPLMEQGLVAVRIAQRESVALPFASQSFVARNTERFLVSSTKLDPPVSYFPAKVEVTFGKELTVGGTEVPLFAPRQ